ncbi:unnamed protein product [Coccothraustes coccothraustes]
MEPLGTQRDYVSQGSPGGYACARQGWLEGGRGGKGKEGTWPSQRALCCSFVPRRSEGSVNGGHHRGLPCGGGRRRNAPAPHGYRRRGFTAGRGGGAEGESGYSPVPPAFSPTPCPGRAPLSVIVAFVSWSRCRVPEPAGTRLCQDRGAGKAGLEGPTPALLRQNNVRFLPLVFF